MIDTRFGDIHKKKYLKSIKRWWNINGTKKFLNFVELWGCDISQYWRRILVQ